MRTLNKYVCLFSLGSLLWGTAFGGEIVLSPTQKEVASQSEAARLMDTARESRTGHSADSAIVIETSQDDDAILAPPRSSGMGASESAAKARVYRQDDGGNAVIVGPEGVSPANGDTAQQARSNRNRAIEYRKGGSSVNAALIQGPDGLPLVDCRATDNVSGRIGDDAVSGNIVVIIQGRKQIKARCR